MATLDIGKRCTYTTCNNVDFLPISCNLCSQIFCRQHSLPDDHDCAETKTAASSRDEQSSNVTSLRATCAVLSCSNTVLGSFSNSDDNMEGGKALCPGCGRAYCALYVHQTWSRPASLSTLIFRHRHAEFHACQPASIDNPTLRNPEAHALLQKHFGVPGAKTALSSKSKPKPIKNKQVLLMKMRQRAIPADASDKNGRYSLQDCILVRTAKPGSDTEQVFWFKKVCSHVYSSE